MCTHVSRDDLTEVKTGLVLAVELQQDPLHESQLAGIQSFLVRPLLPHLDTHKQTIS